MIDNTRLKNDMRLAVVLKQALSGGKNRFNNSGHLAGKSNRIELKGYLFPRLHAPALKEQPYFDDIVSKLLAKGIKL